MNLEQIDTSTAAGKAEVMRLAAEGRRVAYRDSTHEWEEKAAPAWNWVVGEYAIISEPVGPEEVWIVHHNDGDQSLMSGKLAAYKWVSKNSWDKAVRYIRADLAGEWK
ncbi:MAG: hypothetical protein [Caudoviricetes sp.]|nr:MAG: hypothetical protein [Caudoviricetes sp.]